MGSNGNESPALPFLETATPHKPGLAVTTDLRHIGFVEGAVVGDEDGDPVADLHADLVVGEESAVGLSIGNDDLGQDTETLTEDDARGKARVGKGSPVIGIGELGAGDDIAHLTALHILGEDAAFVCEGGVEQVHGGEAQIAGDEEVAGIERLRVEGGADLDHLHGVQGEERQQVHLQLGLQLILAGLAREHDDELHTAGVDDGIEDGFDDAALVPAQGEPAGAAGKGDRVTQQLLIEGNEIGQTITPVLGQPDGRSIDTRAGAAGQGVPWGSGGGSWGGGLLCGGKLLAELFKLRPFLLKLDECLTEKGGGVELLIEQIAAALE